MARAQRPRVFTEQIAVAVTPGMLASLRERATARNCSIADLVRDAVHLRLAVTPELGRSIEEASVELAVPAADLLCEAIEEYKRAGWGVW